MASLIDDLRNSLTVVSLENDHVQVTISLPADIFPHFVKLIESLTGLVQQINHKAKATSQTPSKGFLIQQKQALAERDRHYARIVRLYDTYTSQGSTRTEAIKRISLDLRSENNPWAADYLVRSALTAAGRPGTPGRKPRRNEP